MSTNLKSICLALVALAAFVVLPTVASASPVLTSPLGTAAAVGTKFRSTTVATSKVTFAAGTAECTKGENTGTLVKNNGTEIEGTIETSVLTGTGPEGSCTSPFGNIKVTTGVKGGLPLCMSAKSKYAADELQIRGGACNEASRPITIIADMLSLGVTCAFERTNPVTTTYKTAPEDATAGVSNYEVKLESGQPFVCPTTGNLDTVLTLEKLSETAEPAYVS